MREMEGIEAFVWGQKKAKNEKRNQPHSITIKSHAKKGFLF
jgi:hypothetical protein